MRKILKVYSLLCLMFFFTDCGCDSEFSGKKDVILVLDTSMSMVGHGGSNIMAGVKDSIVSYIDSLESGDRVSFVTFDSNVSSYPSVIIDGNNPENSKDSIKKYIDSTAAEGKWTYTYSMIDAVFNRAEELQKESPERQLVILVMTDGIDDPPPSVQQGKFNIKDISAEHEGKDWWIFLVNFNDLKHAREDVILKRQELQQSLSKVSDKSYIIDSDNDPNAAVSQVMEQEKKNAKIWTSLLLLLLALILFALLLAFIAKRRAQVKIVGSLEYWNNDLIKPSVEKFAMTKYMQKELFIGNRTGCTLRIRDLDLKSPFKITAERVKGGEIRSKVVAGQGTTLEFANPERGEFLENGDTFIAGNYSFRYLLDNPS